jgi:hypothetical protein
MPIDPDAVNEAPVIIGTFVDGTNDGNIIPEIASGAGLVPNAPVEGNRIVLDDEEDVPALHHEIP